jgi:hypothetical protein
LGERIKMGSLPFPITVLKIHNGGNFDFEAKTWLFGDVTGRMI